MTQQTNISCRLLTISGLMLGILALPLRGLADEPGQTISEPGFRPESEFAAAFLDTVGTAKIAVLPTLVRRVDRTAHSFESQEQIVTFLNESGIATAMTKPRRIDLGSLRRPSQWEIFQHGAESMTEYLGGYETGADYTLVMEILVPGNQAVFGIEVYIMDQQGRSAFSFLLNSHHKAFSDAKLVAKNSSEASRNEMIARATQIGLLALKAQIGQARDCIATSSALTRTEVGPGILHNFQSPLASSSGRYGTPLGFSTFSDDTSTVNISRTSTHPALPQEAKGNMVLQLDMDVSGWAGVLYLTPHQDGDTWASQDWGKQDGFSFWLYGNGSGAEMFVDVLDNRNTCSRRDDAERFTYVFLDDVAGWRLISAPFTDMSRKEISNGAPNDGLNLTEVHGWGLGSLNTNGPKTYYFDDFRLWNDRSTTEPKALAVITHELFIETRLDDKSSRLVIDQDSLQGLVIDKVMGLNCAIAKLTSDRGFRYFRIGERAKLSGGRSSMRITFLNTLPDGALDSMELLKRGNTEQTDLMMAPIDAEEVIKACELIKKQSRAQNKR